MNAQLKIDEHTAHGEEHSLGVIEDVAVGLPGEGEAEAATDAQEHSAVKKARFDPNFREAHARFLALFNKVKPTTADANVEGGERTEAVSGNLRGVGGSE